MTAWTDFTKKIFQEGKAKNPDYSFKQALQDASARKGEMKNGSSSSSSNVVSKKSKTSKKSKKGGKKRNSGTRRKRRSVKKH